MVFFISLKLIAPKFSFILVKLDVLGIGTIPNDINQFNATCPLVLLYFFPISFTIASSKNSNLQPHEEISHMNDPLRNHSDFFLIAKIK